MVFVNARSPMYASSRAASNRTRRVRSGRAMLSLVLGSRPGSKGVPRVEVSRHRLLLLLLLLLLHASPHYLVYAEEVCYTQPFAGRKTPHHNHIRHYAKSLSQMKEAGLKAYKPTTPGFRGRVITDRSKLWKGKPLKALTKGLTKRGGRNNSGRITVWHKGGGHKRLYRMIDFKRDLFGVNGVIRRIEYDPNRTTRIALVDYPDGIKPRYILAPEGARAGDVVASSGGRPTNSDDDSVSSVSIDIRPGNAMPLSEMPIGTIVHNVELVPGRGGALARSAGASATLVKKGADGYCAIKLPSGELRLVPSKCVATVGVLSNREHQNTIMGKAGAKRWKGIRPTVRGTAMNPIDHPHGGGEGRSKGNNQSVSPWGVNTKGKRTRNNKRTENMRLQRRPMNESVIRS